MSKTNIKIVVLGNLRHKLDFKKLKRFNSKFFSVNEIEKIHHLPEPNKSDGYLNITYSRKEIIALMKNVNYSDLILGIINYRFFDNFYLHRTGINRACLSIAYIDIVLGYNNISIENFILRNIYEIITYKDSLNDLSSDRINDILHQDTRGCLFDMNGDKHDVIYNTEKPIVCDACKSFFKTTSLPEKYISDLEKELKKINKPFILKAELFIKKHPLFSVLLIFVFSVFINIASDIIWELIK